MSKNRKKRTKKYAGIDARKDDSSVTIHRLTATNRSPLGQWLHEHKKIIKPVIITALIVAITIAGIISLFSH